MIFPPFFEFSEIAEEIKVGYKNEASLLSNEINRHGC